MKDTLTLLKAKPGINMTKVFSGDTVESYGRAKYFKAQSKAVDSIEALSALLTSLEDKPNLCVIRGTLNLEAAASIAGAKDPNAKDHYARIKQIYDDEPHHWVMLDVDNFDTGELSPLRDPILCIERYIADVLPDAFTGVSYHWQLSASAGQPGNEHRLKAHIWFWLETPYDSVQLTAWAKSISPLIDVAPLRTVQVHYTANPIYREGTPDPVKRRSGLISGWMADAVPLVIDEVVLLRSKQYQSEDRDYEFKDPSEKPGVIGAFHRAYTVEEVINELLPHEFEFEPGSDRRVTWLSGGGTPGGCFITDDRQHFGSTHNTDPFDNRVVNLFDLVRYYQFGQLDEGYDPFEILDMRDKPSYQAMLDWCDKDERVQEELSRATADERIEKAHRVQQYRALIESAEDNYALEEDICRRIANDRSLIESERNALEPVIQARFRELTGSRPPISLVRDMIARAPEAGGYPDLNDAGKPLASTDNLEVLLDRHHVNVRYNVMTKEDEILIPGRGFSIDNQAVGALSAVTSLAVKDEMPVHLIKQQITEIADGNPYNPMMVWINSRPWDGEDRLYRLYNTLVVKKEHLALRDMLVRKWLLSAVYAAADVKGVAAQGMLVLTGEQYKGKTRWFKRLVGEHHEMFREGVTLDPRDKDSVKLATSAWITELGELDATFRKSDIAALKAFVTKQIDIFRKPYAIAESKMARRTVFGGTVNDEVFLRDPTGNRRFYTIPVLEVDHNHDIDMQQVWAQVYEDMYLGGETHWLDREWMDRLNEHNEEHTETDSFDELVGSKLDWQADKCKRDWKWMTASEVCELLGVALHRSDSIKVGKALRKRGCERRKSNGNQLLLVPKMRVTDFNDEPEAFLS
jgi:predicted P-loop ATPase